MQLFVRAGCDTRSIIFKLSVVLQVLIQSFSAPRKVSISE